MGLDDDETCVDHVWVLKGIHLSLRRGAELEESCARCGTPRYVTDDLKDRSSTKGRG